MGLEGFNFDFVEGDWVRLSDIIDDIGNRIMDTQNSFSDFLTNGVDITCTSLDAGSGTIQTTGAGVFGTITGTSLDAGSGAMQTTGAISGGSLAITNAAVVGSLDAGSGTIETTGNITAATLTLSGAIEVDSLSVTGQVAAGSGAFSGLLSATDISGTSIAVTGQVAGDSLTISGNIVGNTLEVNASVVADGAILGQTVEANGALSADTCSITNGLSAGAVTCTSLDAGSGTIETTGDADIGGYLKVDTDTLVIDDVNHRVGVGTANPNAPLEVKGVKPGGVGGWQGGQLQVTGSVTDEFYSAVITGHNAFNGNTQLWYLGSTSASSHNNIGFINRQNAAIHFSTNDTFRMAIDAAGNVGIGTTSPDTTLQVVGTAGFGDDAGNETLFAANGSISLKGTASLDAGSGTIETIGVLKGGVTTLGATTCASLNMGSGTIQTTGTVEAAMFRCDAVNNLDDTASPSVSGKSLFVTTGTTEVTDLDDGVVGQRVTIIIKHTKTFRSTGNLHISGTSATLTSGDTIELVLHSDNEWYTTSKVDDNPV